MSELEEAPPDRGAPRDEIDLVVVGLRFRASDASGLVSVLANYVVLARGAPGCRNIDLCSSATSPSTFLVIQKWESPAHQRAHFDSPVMVEMARACAGLLVEAPDIDLYDPISAHDLA